MNDYGEESSKCSFHPKEVIVGVCALCLKERLLILASKQGNHGRARDTHRPQRVLHRKPTTTIPKVFTLGSFLLHRLELRHRKSDNSDGCTYSSREDSFISIKFENNGRASWDNMASPRFSWEALNFSCNYNPNKEAKVVGKSVVEHAKPHGMLRWQKRIGHLFQLMRWKQSNPCRVGSKVEGVKVRKELDKGYDKEEDHGIKEDE